MSVTDNIASAVGTAAGSAVAAPVSGAAAMITAIAAIARPLIDLIPDPQKKLEAQQHIADQQQTLALAQIDQQNKIIAATSQTVSADSKVAGARAYLCYGVSTMILFNYMIVPLLHAIWKIDISPVAIPTNVLAIFAIIMLGFVGIPQAADLVREIAGMPGDSQVSVLGIKLGNKS